MKEEKSKELDNLEKCSISINPKKNCFRKVVRVNIIYAGRVERHRGIIASGVLLQFTTRART